MSELSTIVRGRVTLPGDAGFAQATRPWNLAIEQLGVLAVVEAADREDVAAVVRYARAAGVPVAAQSTGHGASGSAVGAILLRTNRLGGVVVDPAARTARVGAGVQWGEVLAAAGPHGLTGLAGSSPVVGVTGYLLGGGLSWFGRKYGLAADSVRAFDVVDAEGAFARVTAESDAELFAALRGGGGDYAIVTAVEFDLHPAPALYGGRILWPADRAPAVLDLYRDVTASAPDELTVWFDMMNFPGAAPMVAISTTYLGDPATAQDLLRPFEKLDTPIADTRTTLDVAALGTIMAEPTDPSPGLTRSELLTHLPDASATSSSTSGSLSAAGSSASGSLSVAGSSASGSLSATGPSASGSFSAAGSSASGSLSASGSSASGEPAGALTEPLGPLFGTQLRHLGGALRGRFTEDYYLYMFGVPTSPEVAGAIRARMDAMTAGLGDLVSGRKPFTGLASGDSASAALSTTDLARLRALKRARDPHGVFRSNFPV